ncbi:hypothetical protein TPY_3158 [Sulfobacillus acidophilus TPY]|uniref:EamA domain-containing protein n=1 Tax=Sulfobacillus acidophilus (strain ATCC 700253 / DSM 10332 / NAL) TaxID=679936 RepID=G8U146_SULAD|nr:hypothetical protein TPY_3158 [Sulfobacillus acidophilus TPY]AEW04279.1 protein of unknown function DUF6 transmembrane [Sulfobacillus acidophilus DSM 10332]
MTAEAIIYTILWASAAIATKFGLMAGPPLMLASFRFTFAGVFLLIIRRITYHPLIPPRRWWRPLFILGALNTTVYLGASFIALTVIPAGLFNLFVATNPLMVLLVERFVLHRIITRNQWVGLILATAGLALGAGQSLWQWQTPMWSLALIVLGQTAMALGSVYFHVSHIDLPNIEVNMWQLLTGATLLWPVALGTEGTVPIHWNAQWWGALVWLIGGVSIGAMLLWFHLLRHGGARQASFWLLLTPVIGYILGWLLLHEFITWANIGATLLVIGGLILAQLSAPAAPRRKQTHSTNY